MDIEVLISFILSLAIGTLLGLEREIHIQKEKRKSFGGIRTFMLISILGFLITHISINILNSLTAFLIGFLVVSILIISNYVVLLFKREKIGATTEVASILVFILTAIVTMEETRNLRLISIIFAIVIAFILALKENLHKFARNIKKEEIYAAIKMSAISALILPLLPNKKYSLADIPVLSKILLATNSYDFFAQINVFNPFKIWLFVVLIAGISFISYISLKVLDDKRGIKLIGFFGGMVSSTAVTVSLAERGKDKKIVWPFVLGILLASSIMFIRILIEISIISTELVRKMFLPLTLMATTSFLLVFFLKREETTEKNLKLKNPFALAPALKFGLFFIFILFFSKLLYIYLGDKGIFLSAFISGFADTDAITLSLSTLVFLNELNVTTASWALFLAIISNTLTKIAICFWFGNREIAKRIGFMLFLTSLAGLLSLLFL